MNEKNKERTKEHQFSNPFFTKHSADFYQTDSNQN